MTARSRARTQAHPDADMSLPLPALAPALRWRLLGPFRGGRVVAVAGDPIQRQTFYFGSTGGGVWKTTTGGRLWENCSDGFFARASVGALAVAPSDPTVLYAGMGEATIRGNVAHGDGVYRSRDAGATWEHLGLAETRHIAKVRVHPHDPQLVYVAALGHAHGPNAERGIYRSRDGGTSWEQVLTHPRWPEEVGANELALDPTNPRILYAALWRARRLPHTLASGGEGCGLWRSRDGGDTWTELTPNKGLPKGMWGKAGIVASPARAGRVWAIVEANDEAGKDAGGVYRSDDGGDTWERLCDEYDMRSRPWYYQHIHADPQDPDTLWVLNVRAYRSIDGGRTFSVVSIPHGDNHDLWIDPNDPSRIINGNDGGACVSFDGGQTWSSLYNQPTAEMYHVTTDTQTPYRVYGAQQDNTTISLPSRSRYAAILTAEYAEVGGSESGYIAVRPDDPNIVYAGNYQGYLSRYDHRTGQRRVISVWPEGSMGWPAADLKYRFQWTFPIHLSPHDPNTLYTTGNQVFRSRDEGSSWEAISPDLTRHDAERLGSSGGPVTKDNVGTEYYATIFAFAESARQPGVLWAGSDDGLVHVSRDSGANWEEVTPPDLPPWALVSLIEPSPHDPAVAYLAATRYKLDDFTPYLLATDDYGAHWRRITTGLPAGVFTRAIREDPARRGLLYAGTETGVWCSLDDGGHWQPLQLNLPVVPVHDLVIHGSDLLAATHGRSFWALDDLTPLRHLSAANEAVRAAPAHLFPPRTTIRFWTDTGFPTKSESGIFYGDSGPFMYAYRLKDMPNDETRPVNLDAGENPRDGVYVTYLLKERPDGPVTLSFLDSEGREIKTFTSEPKKSSDVAKASAGAEAADAAPALAPAEQPPEQRAEAKDAKEEKPEPRVSKEAGLNRFYWNMRYPGAKKIAGFVSSDDNLDGPLGAPGAYQVRLTAGGFSATERFEIVKDPRAAASQEDLDAQFALLIRIRDKLSEVHDAINTLRSARRQIDEWERRVKDQPQQDQVRNAAKALKEQLAAVEEELTQVKAKSRQHTLSEPIKLNAKIAFLAGVVSSADAAPTTQAVAVFDDLSSRAQTQLDRLRMLLDHDLAAFNSMIRDLAIPAVIPTAEEPKP